jgi:AcrR family transcriptional regulator
MILQAAEGVLRRYGPGKTTVLDVAKALGVSHGSIYRHFPSKAALREAVVKKWLEGTVLALEAKCRVDLPPLRALYDWFQALRTIKKAQTREEPELFASYRVLITEAPAVLDAYKAKLHAQIEGLLARGVASGELAVTDLGATAHALWTGCLIFHHPAHAATWGAPGRDGEFDQLWQILMNGICSRSIPTP